MRTIKHIKTITILFGCTLYVFFNGNIVEALDERPISSQININEIEINLTEGSTKNVVVTAEVTDTDGCDDVNSTVVKFYRTDLGSDCTVDVNNCYETNAELDAASCNAEENDLTSSWTATLPIQYYANPTDIGAYEATNWSAIVIPSDLVGQGTSGTSYTIEVNTLTAIEIAPNISFGEMALGEDTGNIDWITTATNTGNIASSLSVRVSKYPTENDDSFFSMICDSGAIRMENLRYSTTGGTNYSLKVPLSHENTLINSFSLIKRVGAEVTEDLFWGLGIPQYGVGGHCLGTVVFTPGPLIN